MKRYKFSSSLPFQFNFAGKFTAPNAEWTHLTRHLTDYELFVVTQGTLHIADQDRKYTVGKGQYLLMAPTPRQHGYQASDCTFYWLHFQPLSPCEVLPPQAPAGDMDALSIIIGETGTLQSLERMILLMQQLIDSERRYGLRCLNNFHTSTILAELSAQGLIHRRYDNPDSSTQLYSDIVDYITLNICSRLRVSEIADYFGYNEKYLTTCFRKWAKVSLKQFILQKKMEHARAELSETGRSIAQIGYSIGYNDPHNFTNAFRKVTGLTPSEYRSSYSKRRLNSP